MLNNLSKQMILFDKWGEGNKFGCVLISIACMGHEKYSPFAVYLYFNTEWIIR